MFQFRAEALNLTNFAVLSQPDVSIGDAKVTAETATSE